jgi:hypothetical protein
MFTAMMIGWGVFWTLIWAIFFIFAFSSLRGQVKLINAASDPDSKKVMLESKEMTEAKNGSVAGFFGVIFSLIWIVAWVVVRWLAS